MGSHSHIHYPRIEEYSTGLIDVRSKIIATLLIVIVGTLIIDFNQLQWLFLIFILFSVILRPRRSLLKQVLVTLPIIISLSLVSYFSFSEVTIEYSNFLYVTTHNNVSFALFSGFRSLLLTLYVLMLINSESSFYEIIYGLDDLKIPNFLSSLIFLTYRFFFLIQEEFSRILEARSNRLYGEKIHMNLNSLIVLGNIIGSTLARSFKRAEYVSATLSARGFSGKISHPEQPWTRIGIIFIIITLLLSFMISIVGQTPPYEVFGGLK